VLLVGEREHRIHGILRLKDLEPAAEVLHQPSHLSQPLRVGTSLARGHVEDDQVTLRAVSDPASPADQVLGTPGRDTQARMRPRVSGTPCFDHLLRTSSSTWFATRISASSRRAVRLSMVKYFCRASFHLVVVGVDVAVHHPSPQGIRRHVHQLHLVGKIQHPVRDGLLLPDAGDPGNKVIQAGQMLDVDGGDDRKAVEHLDRPGRP
jgi:hypothetical protein